MIRPTLLFVGAVTGKNDLQSVHEEGAAMRSMIITARTDVPPDECEGAIPVERGDNKYEPICYRCSDQGSAGKEQYDTASAG